MAHIINPAVVDPSSDLFVAQPITFETMRIAREFSENQVDINLYAVQFQHEPSIPLPKEFIKLPDLQRSITDIKIFKQKRKLPLIKDILDFLYETANADYLIYTNVDISLQPYFYLIASHIVQQGYDAFVINRRTIPENYAAVAEIPLMYAELGEMHQGWDCFIIHRSLYPRFRVGAACIGSGWIGRVMITNMTVLAKKFAIFGDLHATFHIGNRQAWKDPRFDDYREHNKSECRAILEEFDRKYGPFDRKGLPGRFFAQLQKQ